MADIVVNDADLIADQRAQAVRSCCHPLFFSDALSCILRSLFEGILLFQDMGGTVSAVELMAEQQAAGLGRVHHHQHQYPALSLSHIVPGQYPPTIISLALSMKRD